MSRLSKKDAHGAEIDEIARCVHAEVVAELQAEFVAFNKLNKLEDALGKAKRGGIFTEITAAQEDHDKHKSWCIEQFPDAPGIRRRNFSDTIKSLRVSKALWLWQVASSVGITKLYLERIEEGSVLPPEEVVRDLAKFFETDANELLQLCQEQHVSMAPQTAPRISREAEENNFFWN